MKEFEPLPPCGCTVCGCCTNYADEPQRNIMYKRDDYWVFVDMYGDTYHLRPTGDPDNWPLVITREQRR